MPFKDVRRLPTEDVVVSSTTAHVDRGSVAPGNQLKTITKPPSLHAHPVLIDPNNPRITISPPDPNEPLDDLKSRPTPQITRPTALNIKQSQPAKSRRAQITSQGTVVVSPQTRDQRRKTLAFLPNIAIIDDLKRQAESEYYERKDHTGEIRRRSMMRTVSKEDTLLGRGANPRTGLVLPGSGSIDSNMDSADELVGRNVTPLAKWRQKGDQWVSLGFDEPTPIAAPPDEPTLLVPRPKRPRTPSRFSEQNSSLLANASTLRKRSHTRGTMPLMGTEDLLTMAKNDDAVPGSYPESPTKQTNQTQLHSQRPEATIRRKPVRESSPISDLTTGHVFQGSLNVHPGPLTPPPSRDGIRSQSTSRLPREHSLAAEMVRSHSNTDNLHALSGQTRNKNEFESFLGLRSQTLPDLYYPHNGSQSLTEVKLDKDLPCLPMSSGQFRQIRSGSHPATTPNRSQVESVCVSEHQEHRVKNLMSDKSSRRSHIAEMMMHPQPVDQTKSSDRMVQHGLCAIPNYDNPPPDFMPRHRRTQVGGPRAMPKIQHIPTNRPVLEGVFTDPFSTTTMNIDTFTPMATNRMPRQKRRPRIPPQTQPPPTTPLPPTPRPKTGLVLVPLNNVPVLGDSMTESTCPPKIPARSLDRPQMHPRAIGASQVPQMDSLQRRRDETHMDYYNQLNMTGMQTNAKVGHNVQGDPQYTKASPMEARQSRPLEILECHTGNGKQGIMTGQTRRCSRCENGFVIDKPPNIDGQVDVVRRRKPSTNSWNAPEVISMLSIPTPITEVTEPRSSSEESSESTASSHATSATIVDVESDLRDHGICCPDCCILDCHGSCLGHPSPLVKPSKSSHVEPRKFLQRNNSSSSLESKSGASVSSFENGDKKGKFSLMKAASKLAFWHKHGDNTIKSLRGRSIEKGQVIKAVPDQLVGSNFVKKTHEKAGHDSAVAAAKCAIGFDNGTKLMECGLNQLMVPRKRPSSKRTSTKNAGAGAELTPPPTPPSIKASIAANESRKLNLSRPCSGAQATLLLQSSQTRTISGSSFDMRVPSMGALGLTSLFELVFVVPVEAVRMWLHNNPQVMGFGWSALDCWWNMGCLIAGTSKMILEMVYVYSKTGRFKVRNGQGEKIGPFDLLFDTARSLFYVLMFTSLAIMLCRILGAVLLPIQLIFSMGRYLLLGGESADTS